MNALNLSRVARFATLGSLVLALSPAMAAPVWDAAVDYSSTASAGVNGVWSYGSTGTGLNGAFAAFGTHSDYSGYDAWSWGNPTVQIGRAGAVDFPSSGSIVVPANTMNVSPGPNGEYAVLRTPGAGAQKRVPVIALTAHAFEGEREKCIDAGMDDFLTKPLRAAALRDKLVAWLAPARALPEVAPDPEPQGDPLEAARQMFGAKYSELAQLFLGDAPRRLTALAAAVEAREFGRIADCVHTLAGSAGAVGAAALSIACKRLEIAVRAGQVDGIDVGCAVILHEYAKIDARLQELLAPQV